MKLYHVDAFTTQLFKGNPAGVCLLEHDDIPDRDKILIAAELKHSETAFVLMNDNRISLRWFTPEKEVDLCGHATLSAAHILWEKGYRSTTDILRFDTRSGELTARMVDGRIELDFPRLIVRKCEPDPRLNGVLGIAPVFTGRDDKLILIEIESAEELRKLQPNHEALAAIEPGEFLITCTSDDPRYDFLSRFFAPAVGIPEDPVTGSAHCYLAPYWAEKLGRSVLTGYQASPRGGVVDCEVSGTSRVKLRGHAVTFFETSIILR